MKRNLMQIDLDGYEGSKSLTIEERVAKAVGHITSLEQITDYSPTGVALDALARHQNGRLAHDEFEGNEDVQQAIFMVLGLYFFNIRAYRKLWRIYGYEYTQSSHKELHI
mgnify:CR=1 FL=1